MYRTYRMALPQQKQIETSMEFKNGLHEVATCPFCGMKNTGNHETPSHTIQAVETCQHFRGFVAGAKNQQTIFFIGFPSEEN